MRGYWTSNCPTLLTILDWVEHHDETHPGDGTWRNKAWRGRKLRNDQIDCINELIWGFMNTCLKDGARTAFDSVDTLSGFDAWRAIVQEIQKSRGIR